VSKTFEKKLEVKSLANWSFACVSDLFCNLPRTFVVNWADGPFDIRATFAAQHGFKLAGEYIETEKGHDALARRPKLAAALEGFVSRCRSRLRAREMGEPSI
jgi:hypothetical protein